MHLQMTVVFIALSQPVFSLAGKGSQNAGVREEGGKTVYRVPREANRGYVSTHDVSNVKWVTRENECVAAELGFRQYAPTPLFEDNTGCIALAEHGHFAGRSKHIHLRWMFISEFIRDGILKLHQVPTTQQVAGIGTKALAWPLFCALLYIVFGLA
jgi:hypothetical protein